jgi:hypothetical protein
MMSSTSHSRLQHSPQRGYSFALMLLIIAAVGIISVAWGEKIPINGGLGWDGRAYASMAQSLNLRAFDTYYFQRTLPSILVHFALVVSRQPLDDQHVILAFGLLNLGAMLLACILYRGIADELGLENVGFWFGFVAIFVNFASLKMTWYYPVLTDATAAALALAMLLFYLRRQTSLLLLVALLGAYTWPTLFDAGIFLLAFQREPIVEKDEGTSKWLAVGLATSVCAVAVLHFYVMHRPVEAGVPQPIRVAIPLSLLISALYVYSGSAVLIKGINWRAWMGSLTLGRAAIAVAFVLLVKTPVYLWANHLLRAVSTLGTIDRTVRHSVAKPLVFMVSHPMYFGPMFLLLVFYWKPFSQIIRGYGIGLVLIIWMGVYTSLIPESRQSIPSYVIAAPFLGLLVDKLALPGRFLWLTGALAIVSTRVWMRMNLPAFDDQQYQGFPFQNYFMMQGPWMSNQMYLLQGAIVLVAAALLYLCLLSTGRDLDSSVQ